MNEIIKKNGIQYGLIIASIAIFFQILTYITNIPFYKNMILGFTLIFIYWVIRIFLANKTKKDFKNSITFKEVFTTLFIASTLGIVISSLFNYVFFNFVAIDLGNEINEFMNNKMIESYKIMGKSKAELKEIGETLNFSFSSLFKTCLFSILISAIFNLILSAFFKSKSSNQL
ncbi:DUF4199 domain-containing protein [Flavobacterium sp.]|uniref:DUF4199 domain-containing protein n=1 Tax=Flavobacterium sp. TaxID=239 RepID=UPI003D09B684